jgi:hypothetical protein
MKLLTQFPIIILILVLAAKVGGLGEARNDVHQSDAMQVNTAAIYQIEVAWRSHDYVSDELEGEPISQFDQHTLTLLLSNLGITPEQQEKSPTPAQLPERSSTMVVLPQLWRIANLSREPVVYSLADLKSLQLECERAQAALGDPQPKSLLRDLYTASFKAMERSGEVIVYRHPTLPLAHTQPRLVYTIEVMTLSQESVNGEVVAQFDDAAFRDLWNDLGVSEKRWDQWRRGLQTNNHVFLIEDFPQLSGLASADEGAIRYKDDALTALRAECERALSRVRASGAKKIVQDLLSACGSAIQGGKEVVVHAFGAISRLP